MKRFIILFLLLLILSGCVTGPMSGKAYAAGSPKYGQETKEIYIQQHPDLSEETKQCIRKGEIFVGMTKDEAKASWGEPHNISKTGSALGMFEQWEYSGGKYGSHYYFLYFDNGILKSWQDIDT